MPTWQADPMAQPDLMWAADPPWQGGRHRLTAIHTVPTSTDAPPVGPIVDNISPRGSISPLKVSTASAAWSLHHAYASHCVLVTLQIAHYLCDHIVDT